MSKYYDFTEFFFVFVITGGVTIFQCSLKTTQNEKIFEGGQIFLILFMNPLYEPILVFPKFDLFTASGMALSVNLGPKCQS
jgi:hypothetical protein